MLESRFPEPKKSKHPQGAKRKWPHWLIVSLALLQNSLSYSWRDFTEHLQQHLSILIEFGADKVPSTTSIYSAWRSIPSPQLENLVGLTGKMLSPRPQNVAFDSSGLPRLPFQGWFSLDFVKVGERKIEKDFTSILQSPYCN